MRSSLQILLLEDDSGDAELVREFVEAEGFVCEITRVQTRDEFVTALEHFFSTIGEELAIEALKMGATDYVLKTGLSRLAPSVRRAMREAEGQAERKKAEEALRRSEAYLMEAQRLSHTGSFGWNVLSGEVYWSDETYRIFEYETMTKPTIQRAIDRCHQDDRMRLKQVLERAAMEKSDFNVEHRLMMPMVPSNIFGQWLVPQQTKIRRLRCTLGP